VQPCLGSLRCDGGSMMKAGHGALADADVGGVFAVEDDVDSLIDTPGCRYLPDFRLGVYLAVSEPLCSVACDALA